MSPRKLFSLSLPALAAGLLCAACGSTAPTAGTGTAASRGPGGAPFAFSRCMRSHGVSGFPDPIVHTTSTSVSVQQVAPAGVTASPEFKAANRACAHLEAAAQGSGGPSGGPSKPVLLAFARCLRAHGITRFPDPSGAGRLSLPQISAAGVDVHTQTFFTAARTCVPVTHGQISVAQVAALVNHS